MHLEVPQILAFLNPFFEEYLILYSLNPSISCGRSSTHSAAVLTNIWLGHSNSLWLVLLWSESNCWEVVISELSFRSITSSASSRLIGYSRVLGCGLYDNLLFCMALCRIIKEQYGFTVVVSHTTRITCKFQVSLFGCCMCSMLENLYVSFQPFLIYCEVQL